MSFKMLEKSNKCILPSQTQVQSPGSEKDGAEPFRASFEIQHPRETPDRLT